MKIPVKSVISKTDVKKLRKKRQVKAKKTAILRKNFRRLNESSKTFSTQFQESSESPSTSKRLSSKISTLISKSIPETIDNIAKEKLLPIIKSRGYN
ncbi:hypothetical protein DYB32_010583 [Aphanomyces invadans]|uniref:Uncharacterized protein n=1 Tax=Aphanomyces invadans TaxID=157072 RepID=A0A3R6WDT1_9STRA|nr:hypothetical protein DYB32_010583 [Aphanomyces invadans]